MAIVWGVPNFIIFTVSLNYPFHPFLSWTLPALERFSQKHAAILIMILLIFFFWRIKRKNLWNVIKTPPTAIRTWTRLSFSLIFSFKVVCSVIFSQYPNLHNSCVNYFIDIFNCKLTLLLYWRSTALNLAYAKSKTYALMAREIPC